MLKPPNRLTVSAAARENSDAFNGSYSGYLIDSTDLLAFRRQIQPIHRIKMAVRRKVLVLSTQAGDNRGTSMSKK